MVNFFDSKAIFFCNEPGHQANPAGNDRHQQHPPAQFHRANGTGHGGNEPAHRGNLVKNDLFLFV